MILEISDAEAQTEWFENRSIRGILKEAALLSPGIKSNAFDKRN